MAKYVYDEHVVFKPPEDENVIIWKYMPFHQYVCLLQNKALYFSRADKLNDPFEGSITNLNIKQRRSLLKGLSEDHMNGWSEFIKCNVRNTILSCWHMNNIESFAMWKIYLNHNEGLAIKSTYKNLKDSFQKFDGVAKGVGGVLNSEVERVVMIGTVSYIDYETGIIPANNVFWPFVHKRKYFEYERELRALSHETPSTNRKINIDQTCFPDGGDYVPCDLSKLVTEVIVSPYMEEWYASMVDKVTKQYGQAFSVRHSSMAKKPIH